MTTRKAKDIDKTIGLRIKERRILLGFSQEVLGDKVGVSFQQIQKYEKGTNRVSASRLPVIAEELKTGLYTFYRDEDLDPSLLSRDTIEMFRAFSRVKNPTFKKQLINMARTMAEG